MSDDDLLARLAAAERARLAGDPLGDPRLDALADGELSDADLAALNAEAAGDDALTAAVSAFTPLDERAKDRFVEAIVSQTHTEQATRRRRRWALSFGVAVAAAVALVALSIAGSGGVPTLPKYALEVTVTGALRGDTHPAADAPVVIPADAGLTLVLRPRITAETGVHALVLRVRDGEVTPWDAPTEVAPSGAVRIRATPRELAALGPGAARVVVIVAHAPIDLATARDVIGQDDPPSAAGLRGWRLFERQVEVAVR